MAQEELSRTFSPTGENSQDGNCNGHGPHEVVAATNGEQPIETAPTASEAESAVLTEGEVVSIRVRQASYAT
jgi:hypothetical protein